MGGAEGGVSGQWAGSVAEASPRRRPRPPSGHSSGLGDVCGGEAGQRHLHCGGGGGGPLAGSSLGGRGLGGAEAVGQGVAGVSPAPSAHHHAAVAAGALQHGAAAHLVHQVVDLLLFGGRDTGR